MNSLILASNDGSQTSPKGICIYLFINKIRTCHGITFCDVKYSMCENRLSTVMQQRSEIITNSLELSYT
jgi:hypothetical protein